MWNRCQAAWALSALLLLGALPVLAQGLGVSIQYGGEPDLDACQGQGVVKGLDPGGDNFLSVRGGPGISYIRLDKLKEGFRVQLCDEQGEWIGIVYDPSGRQDCGTGAPLAKRQPYRGPCKSGWVFGKYITTVAG